MVKNSKIDPMAFEPTASSRLFFGSVGKGGIAGGAPAHNADGHRDVRRQLPPFPSPTQVNRKISTFREPKPQIFRPTSLTQDMLTLNCGVFQHCSKASRKSVKSRLKIINIGYHRRKSRRTSRRKSQHSAPSDKSHVNILTKISTSSAL